MTSGDGPKPQVDPGDIAVVGPLLHQLDEPPAIAHRRLARLVARAPRQGRGIEQQDEVDVGRIVELAAAELAQRQDRKAPAAPRPAPVRASRSCSASSIAASAKSDRVAVTHSSGCSPLRSASATASASAWRRRRSRSPTVSPSSASARATAASLPSSTKACGDVGKGRGGGAQERRMGLGAVQRAPPDRPK